MAQPLAADEPPVVAELGASVRGEVLGDEISREMYASSASICYLKPLAVVRPRDKADVVATVEVAARHGVSVTPRGAGTGLAGQSLGEGVVIDLSVHMRAIGDVDVDRRLVRVEPGAIRDDVSRAAAAHGLMFPPNPSSSAYITIGGMIACNSGGTQSFKYGTTKDWIHTLDLVLADGSEITLTAPPRDDLPAPAREAATRALGGTDDPVGPAAGVHNPPGRQDCLPHPDPLVTDIEDIVADLDAQAAIAAERPRSRRNSCGYNLYEALTPDGRLDLSRVIAGSEGTLAIIVGATLRLAPVPPHRVAFVALFADAERALATVPALMAHEPATIQALDRGFIDVVAAEAPALTAGLDLPAAAGYLLLVELEGDDPATLAEQERACIDELHAANDAESRPLAIIESPGNGDVDDDPMQRLWAIRKLAAPLLSRLPGPRPTRFIEDGAIPPDQLVPFVRALRDLLARHGIDALTFGHAGCGLLHFSPRLDRQRPDFAPLIRDLVLEHGRLCRELGGVPSGEHGDGLLRTPLLPELFPRMFPLFAEVKRRFDPAFTLNPKVIVPREPYGPADHLRHGREHYRRVATDTAFDRPALADAVELCHGCGKCRTYCPVMRVGPPVEEHLPRAKANLLRGLIAGKLDATAMLADPGMKAHLDFCIGCRLCLVECPTAVDVPGMAVAFRTEWVRRNAGPAARPPLIKRPEMLGRLASMSTPLANFALDRIATRKVFEAITRIKADVNFARLERRRWQPGEHRPPAPAPMRLPFRDRNLAETGVAIFPGCHGTYTDPAGEIGSLLAILAALGVTAHVLPPLCCGEPAIVAGYADAVLDDLRLNRARMLHHVEAGRPLVFTSSSCAIPFAESLPRLLPGESSEQVAAAVTDVHELLLALFDQRDDIASRLRSPAEADSFVAYHAPCHLRAAGHADLPLALLARVPGLRVHDLGVKCCGMAGTFGLQTDTAGMAREIAEPLFEAVARLDPAPQKLVSPCGTCQMMLHHGTGLPVAHPLAILVRALPPTADS